MPDLKEGDEVRILSGNRLRQAPRGGHVGIVTKVGRKYVTVIYEIVTWNSNGEDRRERTLEFDMATGRERGSVTTTTGYYIQTPQQVAARENEAFARATLSDHGIELSHRHSFTLEQLEALAAVAETFGQEG